MKEANSLEMLNQARSLFYHYYIEIHEWEIYDVNHSGICIVKGKEGFMLEDNYDEESIWFLLYLKQIPIGCIRICGVDQNKILEIEEYANVRRKLKDIFSKKKQLNLVGFNREVVLPQYGCDQSLLCLLEAPIAYCLQKNRSILTSCVFQEWYTLYTILGFEELTSAKFKYYETEPHYLDVFFAESMNLLKILNNIPLLLNLPASPCLNNLNHISYTKKRNYYD